MAVTIDYSKLRILPDPDTREWWEAARQHRYLVRQCKRCGHTAGKGVIHSYVVVVQPIVGAFVSSVPYVVAIIELDDCKEADGTVTRVAGVLTNAEAEVAIGLPCTVLFEETNDPKIVMPRWRISGEANDTWKFSE
jgi:uncharacterized protein